MQDQDEFFAPMPSDAASVSGGERPITISYSAMKVDGDVVKYVDEAFINEKRAKCKAGFSYYDKEAKTNVKLDSFTFIVLEVYSGVEGVNEVSGNFINYYSNRVKNTQEEPLVVWRSNQTEPIAKGIYKDIKTQLEHGKFRIYVHAYCVELDRVIELPLTSFLQQGIQEAVAADQARQGRHVKPDSVSCFGLADGDYIRGFRWTGDLKRVGKKGEAYQGQGDMFMVPVLSCGIVQAFGKQADLHAKAVSLQAEIRAGYALRKAKFAEKNAATVPSAEAPHAPAPAPAPPPRQEPADDEYFPAPQKVPMPLPSEVLPATSPEQKRLDAFLAHCDKSIKTAKHADHLTELCQKALDALDGAYADISQHTQSVMVKFDRALKALEKDEFIYFSINKATKKVEIKLVEQKAKPPIDGLPVDGSDLPF